MQRWVHQNINAEKDKAELDFPLILSSFLCRVKTSRYSPPDMPEQVYQTEKDLVSRRKLRRKNADKRCV